MVATNRQQKIRYFKEATRLNPGYTLAALQLGKVYYDNHEYEQAASWLSKIPKDDPVGGEATFLLGMSEYYRGSLDRAYAAFSYLATRLPLTEVYNNLGVVDARRGRRTAAVEYFSKAVAADPSDPDYRFNLAVALFKNGDSAGAARQLREELQRRPNDRGGEVAAGHDWPRRYGAERELRQRPVAYRQWEARLAFRSNASSAITTRPRIVSLRWRSTI